MRRIDITALTALTALMGIAAVAAGAAADIILRAPPVVERPETPPLRGWPAHIAIGRAAMRDIALLDLASGHPTPRHSGLVAATSFDYADDGALIVARSRENDIVRLDPLTGAMEWLFLGIQDVTDLATAPDGSLVLGRAERNEILRLDPVGAVLTPLFEGITHVSASSSTRLRSPPNTQKNIRMLRH